VQRGLIKLMFIRFKRACEKKHIFLLSTVRHEAGKVMISDSKQHIMVQNRILSWQSML